MADLKTYFEDRQDEIMQILEQLVLIDSPSGDKDAVDRVGVRVEAFLQQQNIAVERIPRTQSGDLLLARLPGRRSDRKILIMGHMDTVWPLGTLAERPPKRIGDKWYAPGAADMKGGLAITMAVLQALQALKLLPQAEVLALFTPDEETGSLNSRGVIESLARDSQLAICMEPGMQDGALKTARKGGMTVRLHATGRAAHAGADHASGVNAIAEMAHQILALQAETDYERGTTVSVGRIEGGVATNIVPPECTAWVDIRMTVPEERVRMKQVLRELKPYLSGAALEVSESEGRPPMPRSEQMAASFAQARELGRGYGLALTEASTGGASDANLAFAVGTPVLDGMGVVGGGLHAVDEYIEVSSLSERALLLAAVLTGWHFA
jgi:glutamate carboxypeptidase